MDKAQRLRRLFQAIVQEYIKTARPVSSQGLADQYGFEYSPATIRHDMAVLEQQGLIAQPHTSAGRVPTEKGYQYYIQHFIDQPELKKAQKSQLDSALQQAVSNQHEQLRQVARTIAAMTDEAVVVADADENYYYTGIAHIFRKPDFADEHDTVVEIGEALDNIDTVMTDVERGMQQQWQVLIGTQNPFSNDCAVVIGEISLAAADDAGASRGLVAILGPMRMDYDMNIAIVQYMESLMEDDHGSTSTR